MKLAKLSLANRALVALIAVVAAVAGAFAIPSLKQELLPPMELPAAAVIAPYPGAAPDLVEDQVTRPIETAVRGTRGVSELTSVSTENLSSVQVQFDYGTSIGDAVNEMQRAVNRLQLPEDVDPTVVAGSTDMLPALVLTATSDRDSEWLAERLDTVVVPDIESVTGVREASVSGARTTTVTITPDQAALGRAGLAPAAISDALQANGTPFPAGAVTDGDRTLTVHTGERLTSVEELAELPLTPGPDAVGAGGPVRLGDVAEITETEDAATSLTRTNGSDSLGISVTLTPEGNAVEVSRAVQDLLPELERALGEGTELTVVFDQAPFVERSIEGLTTEGALGLVFAILVILLFLFSFRSTIVTAVSIPLSLVVALLAMWAGGLSLNMLTLGALTISVGRVVDDSIVVLENIKRHLSYTADRRRAVLDGVREVAGAITASTLTTVAVFAPIAFAGGIVGELFSAFAFTSAVALLGSLLVALTIIPVLAYWFLRSEVGVRGDDAPEEDDDTRDGIEAAAAERERRSWLQRVYLPVLRFATVRRWATVGIAALVLVGTVAMVPRLETNFLDASGQNTLSLRQEMPAGTSLEATDAAAREVEEVLADIPEVSAYQVTVGGGTGIAALFGGGSDTASFSLTLDEDADATEVEGAVRDRVAGLTDVGEITVGAGGGGFNTSQLQVNVQAPDQDDLLTATDLVRETMAGLDDVTDVTSDLSESVPRIRVAVDREAAAARGLSEGAIGQLVAQTFRGAPVGELTIGEEPRDVVLRTVEAPATPEEVRQLTLPTPAGPVRLAEVAEVSEAEGPVQLKRIDGFRSATVTATATSQNIGATSAELIRALDAVDLPAGASYSLGGVTADQDDAFAELQLALFLAVAIVFVIMVGTFRSLVQPLILLVSVPFAATGAVGLLLVTGTALGVPALIGMLMLIGIVVTNAIVLIDLINQYRDRGMSVQDAVVEGGRRRLRPILMTAAATIFALVPMALGITGDGGFISRPLALVVIGGLVTSTLLTLALVPALYTIVENGRERLASRAERRRSRGEPADGNGTEEVAPAE
ncbi:efflux RND transporter permease subunit [Actinoalloteichus spitiensis]|uniref:efflux RND transporter permease subunit n=1 Tax=Actinoalloteichus spitiensis TaxID=252394 RepID=UPI000360D4CF|nr:efflux RND transporter permease subunit [Actinoalloteichus spitiensis]